MQINPKPTPNDDLNRVLANLVHQTHTILGPNFVGAYLQGSFAHGGWDQFSDVDFMVVIHHDLSPAELAQLQAMHPQINAQDSYWAKHLEGSYFPKDLLLYGDADHTPIWYLDNGATELIRDAHDNELVVRWVIRERGIVLSGPHPAELIAPVPVNELKAEVAATMQTWGREIVSGRYAIDNGWAQPFAALSYARMLQTLAEGKIDSKPAAVYWAQQNLAPRWSALIEKSWNMRSRPSHTIYHPANRADVTETLDFIEHALSLIPAK